jgi:antitoxin MazE
MPNDARLSKWGNSLAVKIPQTIIKGDGSIVLRSGRPTYSLKQLVRGIKPGNRHRETDWGTPKGKEAW